jgi:hypothetical protein
MGLAMWNLQDTFQKRLSLSVTPAVRSKDKMFPNLVVVPWQIFENGAHVSRLQRGERENSIRVLQ